MHSSRPIKENQCNLTKKKKKRKRFIKNIIVSVLKDKLTKLWKKSIQIYFLNSINGHNVTIYDFSVFLVKAYVFNKTKQKIFKMKFQKLQLFQQ